MKYGIAKLPQTFYKNTEKKSLNAKKQIISSIEDRKVNTSLCYDRRKSFITWQVRAVAIEDQEGLAPHFRLEKILFFGTSCNDKKTENDAKKNNNHPSYLLD